MPPDEYEKQVQALLDKGVSQSDARGIVAALFLEQNGHTMLERR
jgi:hypothetical protein